MDGFKVNHSLNLKVTVTNTLKKNTHTHTAQLDYFINYISIQKSIRRNRIVEELCNLYSKFYYEIIKLFS